MMANQPKIKINYYLNRATSVLGPVQNFTVLNPGQNEPVVRFNYQKTIYTVQAVTFNQQPYFQVQAQINGQTVVIAEPNYKLGLKIAHAKSDQFA